MVPEIFLKDPPELVPSLFNVKASAPIVMLPDNSNAAPLATVVPDTVVPSAVLFAAVITPAEIVVRPVYELAPDKVNVPAPALVRVVFVPKIVPE